MCSYIVMLWCIDPQGRVHNYSTIASQVPYTCMGKTKLKPIHVLGVQTRPRSFVFTLLAVFVAKEARQKNYT